jgi:hypothetical protein
MPILFELMVLALVAYGTGLALGWAIWGRDTADLAHEDTDTGIDSGETEI